MEGRKEGRKGERLGYSLGSSASREPVQCKPWAVEGEGSPAGAARSPQTGTSE